MAADRSIIVAAMSDDADDEPADVDHVHLFHDERGEEHGGNAADARAPAPAAARRRLSSRTVALLIGIRNAQEPIMMGNAALAFMPSRPTRIMHGAYRPMPSVISAPSTKLPASPSDQLHALKVQRAVAGARSPGWRCRSLEMLRHANRTASDEQRARPSRSGCCASASSRRRRRRARRRRRRRRS